MDVKVVVEEDKVFEIEFSEKELPVALLPVLRDSGVEVYTYEPHPLKPGFRLHIEAANPRRELEKALKSLDRKWAEFGKKVLSKS